MLLAKADIVVNFAPQDFMSLPQHHKNNYKTPHFLEECSTALVAAAGRLGVKRLIHLSPAYLYGATHHAVNEDAPIHRENALFNHAAEAEEAIFDGAIPGYVVRAGFIYGGWIDAMMTLAEHLRRGKGVAKGEGNASWIHEDDLARLLLLLVEYTGESESIANIINAGDGHPMTHNAFMNLFGTLYGVGEPGGINPFLFPIRTNEIQISLLEQTTLLDTSKAKTMLGWEPSVASKEAGIERAMVVWRALDAGDDEPPRPRTTGKELAI
jgi:nucleoside-diphosphate-sugar epimerase